MSLDDTSISLLYMCPSCTILSRLEEGFPSYPVKSSVLYLTLTLKSISFIFKITQGFHSFARVGSFAFHYFIIWSGLFLLVVVDIVPPICCFPICLSFFEISSIQIFIGKFATPITRNSSKFYFSELLLIVRDDESRTYFKLIFSVGFRVVIFFNFIRITII